ncbi:Transposable element P transposase, partial [Paramuricea clavata]
DDLDENPDALDNQEGGEEREQQEGLAEEGIGEESQAHSTVEDPDEPNSRKILQTGSIPTENLPLRSHETKKTPRRVIEKKAPRQELQEDIPSSSHSYLEPGLCSDDLINQLDNDTLLEWKSEVCDDGNVNFFLTDNVHGVAKYTVVMDSCSMEFTAYAFNWPILDDHNIYNEYKRSIKSGEQFREVLSTIEKSKLCEGVPEDHQTKNAAIDPNTNITIAIPRTVIRHSVPKKPSPKQFEATVFFRSPNCDVIIERSEVCDPCSIITKQLKKTNKKRAKTSPAKIVDEDITHKLFGLLHPKSPSAYRELRESGALVLPSERVSRDYKNYFSPKAGVNAENVESLQNKVKSFSGIQRYVVLVMDEMKIQSNLVYDKHSGDLIGFIDLGDPMTNYACLDKEDSVATHAWHFLLEHVGWEDECDVVYKTLNLFAPSRFVYFADSPHLLKTAQNCLYNSGSGSHSRYMWNNGKYLLFNHIADLFYQDQAVELHVLPKLTLNHITLTSYSKMKVRLATQVLSRSVAIALEESGNSDVLETAQFCRMMNDFFDCTNYLESWKASTHEREGDFSDDARGKMFLSMQTYKGLKISVFSHVEAIKFLLENGFQYVLSERFMQDVLEDYFGHQRSKGQRADNPSAYEFGYNDLTIAAQRDIAPVVRGNVGGRYEKKKWFAVSDEPVQKRKKK